MRLIILIGAIGFMASSGWMGTDPREWDGIPFVEPEDPHAAAAIELRCADEMDAFRDDCEEELEKNFELGVREPEEILRRHCTRFTSDWALTPSSPPNICQEMYGGWIKS